VGVKCSIRGRDEKCAHTHTHTHKKEIDLLGKRHSLVRDVEREREDKDTS